MPWQTLRCRFGALLWAGRGCRGRMLISLLPFPFSHLASDNQRLTLEVVNREQTFHMLFKSTPVVGGAASASAGGRAAAGSTGPTSSSTAPTAQRAAPRGSGGKPLALPLNQGGASSSSTSGRGRATDKSALSRPALAKPGSPATAVSGGTPAGTSAAAAPAASGTGTLSGAAPIPPIVRRQSVQ